MTTAELQVEAEYERCIYLARHPDESPELFDVVGSDMIALYWTWRAEGLGFALDRMKRERKTDMTVRVQPMSSVERTILANQLVFLRAEIDRERRGGALAADLAERISATYAALREDAELRERSI